MTAWKRLYQHYKDYHAFGPPRLKYMGWLGLVSLSSFYFVRFTRPNPELFDDIVERGLAMAMLLLLALKDHWPQRARPYYIGYSYVVLVYCLPCFTVLVALQRGGGMPSISNTFIVLCFLVLLTDWRNTLVMLFAGTGLAALIYVLLEPQPRLPTDLIAQLPAYILIVIGGNLFKFSTEQIDAERRLLATQALAGSIAHEMRNPLIHLKHNLENMQAALPEPRADAGEQALTGKAVNDLYRFVADGELAVSRGLQVIDMTLNEVSAKPVDASAFAFLSAAESAAKAVREYGYGSEAERSRVRLETVEDFHFKGDETAFIFVLFNLIKNALYYLPLHPRMEVVITVGAGWLTVRDTGPGMPPDVVERVFEPFRSMGKTGGTGLGLAYCQRVVRSFGGAISCASVPGDHTEFTIRLPAVPAEDLRAHEASVLQAAARLFAGRRLLVVDDDAGVRMATCQKLGGLGAQVEVAEGGEAALGLLARVRFDLVVLDLHMRGLDGYAVARALRAHKGGMNAQVPVVAHSSEPVFVASVKARKAGIDGFVAKPASQQQLVRALQQALVDAQRQGGLAGATVLVADDNAWSRRAVCAYLRQVGVSVVEAEHGQAVLDQMATGRPWLAVLMDLHMPGLDGLEAAQAIRRTAGPGQHVPIIAMTARSDKAAAKAAQAAGMNDFITKPIDAETLYGKLRRLAVRSEPAAPATPRGSAAPPPPEQAVVLLDAQRIANYRRLGLMDELIDVGLPELERLVEALARQTAAEDAAASRETLHALLGMAGEMGAAALYQEVRKVYVPLVEQGQWLLDAAWHARFGLLAARSVEALRATAQAPAAGPASVAGSSAPT